MPIKPNDFLFVEEIAADAVYLLTGYRADTELMSKAGIRLNERDAPVFDKETFGAATIILAGDELVILTERGELIRAPASAAGFKPSARAQILPTQVRAHAALADG